MNIINIEFIKVIKRFIYSIFIDVVIAICKYVVINFYKILIRRGVDTMKVIFNKVTTVEVIVTHMMNDPEKDAYEVFQYIVNRQNTSCLMLGVLGYYKKDFYFKSMIEKLVLLTDDVRVKNEVLSRFKRIEMATGNENDTPIVIWHRD